MEQLPREKMLTVSYMVCAIAGATASITNGIAWNHWYLTLDKCGIGRNCSCILYGQHTPIPTEFNGGGQVACIWVTFGPLVYVFFALCFLCFHGYRVAFTVKSPRARATRSVIAKLDPGESVQISTLVQQDTSPLPRGFWIFKSVFAVFFFVYSLVHFAIFLDGFNKTCDEYRHSLENLLGLHGGSALPVIHNRLHCQSVFDFMDYLTMESVNVYRNGTINTGLDLTIGIVMAGFACVSFFVASILNIIMAKIKSSDDL